MNMESDNEDRAILEDVENEGMKDVKRCLKKMYCIWDDFGMDKDKQSHRAKEIWIHILNLVKEILDEETILHKETTKRVEDIKMQIEKLSSIFSVVPKEIRESSLLKKEELLNLEFENLCQLKNERIKTYQDLKATEFEYCQILNLPGHKLIHDSGIPTEEDINEIKHHVEMLKTEKHQRLKRLSLIKNELRTIWVATELTPETSIEREVFLRGETFSLSNETFQSLDEVIGKVRNKKSELEIEKKSLLKRLEVLWERLQFDKNQREEFLSRHVDCRLSTLKSIQKELERCEKIKMEKIELFIDSLQKELNALWGKCRVSEAVRQEFKYYSTTVLNDEALEAFESELKKWKKYYEDVQHILKNILKREELWNLKTVLEKKSVDPNRFKNRKGNLLQEERERKRIQKDLPILENIIIKEIEEYEALHNCKFLYDGEDYRKMIMNKQDEKAPNSFGLHLLPLKTPEKRPTHTSIVPKSAPGKSNAGKSATFTPSIQSYKVLPRTVGKCVGYLRKDSAHTKSQKMVLKERNQPSASAMKASLDSTTYTLFSSEVNKPARKHLRSSVLSTRRPSGSRISKKSLSKKNAKCPRKSLRLSSSSLNSTSDES